MDALKFIEERNRMCDSFEACGMCPAYGFSCSELRKIQQNLTIVSIVEQWSKENPRKTRQDVFLEQYPNAVLDKNGVLRICPSFVGGDTPEKCKCICLTDCSACRQEYWNKEVQDGC